MEDCMDLLFRNTDLPDYETRLDIRLKKEVVEEIIKRTGVERKDESDVINELLEKALKAGF